MENVKKRPMIRWYGKLFYGAGNLGYGLIAQTYVNFLVYFGTVVCAKNGGIAVSGTLMGLAMALGTIWDSLTDPLIGNLSDRINSKLLGKRHGFLLLGSFLMAIFNIILWTVPMGISEIGKFFWFLIFIMFLETANTIFVTPYNALGMELAGDYEERTVLQSYKSVFFLLSMIVPVLLMMLFTSADPLGKDGVAPYQNMAYLASTICVILGCVCFFGTYSHLPRLQAKDKLIKQGGMKQDNSLKSILKTFFAAFKNKHYRPIILGSAISLMVAPFLTSVGFHMFTYTFKLGDMQMYSLMGVLLISAIISQPLWIFLSKKFDKKPALLIGMSAVLVGILYVFIIFLMRGSLNNNPMKLTATLVPGIFLAGLGTGSMYPLPYSMMADAIAYNSKNEKEDRTATYTGVMTLAYKASQGFALLVIGILLDVIRFDASRPVQPASVESGLGWIVILGVAISIALGIFIYSRYTLKASDVPNFNEVATPQFEIEGMPTTASQNELLNNEQYLEFLNSLSEEEYRKEIHNLKSYSVEMCELIKEKQKEGKLRETVTMINEKIDNQEVNFEEETYADKLFDDGYFDDLDEEDEETLKEEVSELIDDED